MKTKLIECICNGCIATNEDETILDNGYCEECFDQGCDYDDDVHG